MAYRTLSYNNNVYALGKPLDNDDSIVDLGLREEDALAIVVPTIKAWYQLLDKEGNPYLGSAVAFVRVRHHADKFEDLLSNIYVANRKVLVGIPTAHIKTYLNWKGRSNQTKLDLEETICSLDTSAKDPLLVVVPTEQLKVVVVDENCVSYPTVSRDPIPLTYDIRTVESLLTKVYAINREQSYFTGIRIDQLALYPSPTAIRDGHQPIEHSESMLALDRRHYGELRVVVPTRLLWYVLLDPDGSAFLNSPVASIPTTSARTVGGGGRGFQIEVYEANKTILGGLSSWNLAIYPNKASIRLPRAMLGSTSSLTYGWTVSDPTVVLVEPWKMWYVLWGEDNTSYLRTSVNSLRVCDRVKTVKGFIDEVCM